MLRLPPFEYLAPRTIAEAVMMLAERGPEAMIVAGGTDLYPNMKRRQFEPKALVGLRAIPELGRIESSAGGGITIGAGTTLTQVSRHPLIAQSYPALVHAAGVVSTAQLRNMGTIGGNLCLDTRCNYYNQTYHWRKSIGFCLKKDGDPSAGSGQAICLVAPGGSRCWAVSSSDTAPVMIALGASVKLVGPNGERVIPADALYRDDGMNYITKAPNEILTEIMLPPADGLRTAYLKLRRRGSFDFPILGVAVALRLADEEAGPAPTCAYAKIVLGAVGSRPAIVPQAESILVGHKLTPEVLEAAAQAAARLAKPMDNTDSVLAYRKKMAHVFTVRALKQAANLP